MGCRAAEWATEEIEGEIANMLNVSAAVIGALGTIRERIENVREYVGSTAAAVNQQTSIATEMSDSMKRAAQEASLLGGRNNKVA
ncbi:MAG: hypothetical protein VW268_11070 [Rhodospirillaceae bacterium]